MTKAPSRAFVVAQLRARGFDDVPPETVDDLVPAVHDLWDLAEQVKRDLAALGTSGAGEA